MANSVDPDQTAPIGAVCYGSTLFVSILNLSVLLGNYLQQTTSAEDIFRCIFFLAALRVNADGIIRKTHHSTSLHAQTGAGHSETIPGYQASQPKQNGGFSRTHQSGSMDQD